MFCWKIHYRRLHGERAALSAYGWTRGTGEVRLGEVHISTHIQTWQFTCTDTYWYVNCDLLWSARTSKREQRCNVFSKRRWLRAMFPPQLLKLCFPSFFFWITLLTIPTKKLFKFSNCSIIAQCFSRHSITVFAFHQSWCSDLSLSYTHHDYINDYSTTTKVNEKEETGSSSSLRDVTSLFISNIDTFPMGILLHQFWHTSLDHAHKPHTPDAHRACLGSHWCLRK